MYGVPIFKALGVPIHIYYIIKFPHTSHASHIVGNNIPVHVYTLLLGLFKQELEDEFHSTLWVTN